MRLRDKVAIITGAGSGIGCESALLFAHEGAKVAVADVSEQLGRAVAARIGNDAMFVRVDVSKAEDVKRLVGETVNRFGRVDILFNNAGIGHRQATTVIETPESVWDEILAVNLKGVFLATRQVLPVMVAQRSGAIVNTASINGLAAVPRLAAYCASKGGVVSLTRQLAVDYGAYNIRVNCICPGALEKPMGPERSAEELAERRARLLHRIPLAKLCTARDVAYAALYLASDESSHVTGLALTLDGGELAL